MMDMMGKMFENMTKDDKMQMMNMMGKAMGSGEISMHDMCREMCKSMMHQESNGSEEKIKTTPEIKNLFEEWVRQIREEINNYLKENKTAGRKEIAQYLKISEESVEYFIRDLKNDETPDCEDSQCSSEDNADDSRYEVVKIEKIKNVCPMCEKYAGEQAAKPVVIISCEGACLRGEISRRAANLICHNLLPEKTVRLCLGGAFTKDGGQRNLVRNAKRVVALEGCFIKCASRMMKGVVGSVEPEIIVTDKLFDFDTDLFGIDEMSEEDIKKNSLEVAGKIADRI